MRIVLEDVDRLGVRGAAAARLAVVRAEERALVELLEVLGGEAVVSPTPSRVRAAGHVAPGRRGGTGRSGQDQVLAVLCETGDVMSAGEVFEVLAARGVAVTKDSVSTYLGNLVRDGAAIREGRGRFRATASG